MHDQRSGVGGRLRWCSGANNKYLWFTYLRRGAHVNRIYRTVAEGDVTSVWVEEEVIAG